MPESTIAPSASGEGAAWKMILGDNSTWLKEMTKLGYRLHLLSSDFDKLHDQNQTSNASQVYLVLVIESAQTKDGDADQNDHPPLREKFFKELRTHDWQNEMGRDILLKHSGIILNVSTYYVNGDVQSPFADFTRLCRKKEAAPGDEGQTRSRLRAVTYGTENSPDSELRDDVFGPLILANTFSVPFAQTRMLSLYGHHPTITIKRRIAIPREWHVFPYSQPLSGGVGKAE
ncbi:hypothetical protein AUP68_11306 [Ilyonectria robusta]